MRNITMFRDPPNPKQNRLLALMAPADYEAVVGRAALHSLSLGATLYEQDEPIDAIYFPLDSMVSLLVGSGDGPAIEMATVGREGVVGAMELLVAHLSMGMHLIQIPGAALRLDGDVFRELVSSRPKIKSLLQRHMFALMRQVLFGAACNQLHSMEQRCARWLLMTHDRAGADRFLITQETLSHMLGVRRATVNVATGTLKKAGYISYVRGQVTILDRQGLESAACDCYTAIVRIYDTVLQINAGAPA